MLCSGTQLCFTSAFVLLLHCTGVSTLGKPSRRALQVRTVMRNRVPRTAFAHKL